MSRVVCIGECMVELRPAPGDILFRGFAGDAYNTAVYLKRSAPEVQVQFATAVGADGLSIAMRGAWLAEGVEDDLAFPVEGRTPGLYLIETDARGERRFLYWRSESAAKGWVRQLSAKGGAQLLEGADIVYLSGISLAILSPADRCVALDLLRALKGRVGQIVFDTNYRPLLWGDVETAREIAEEAIRASDVVLPSQEDLEKLYGEAAPERQMAHLVELGVPEAAITTGPGRCLVHAGHTRWVEGERASVVVDTSGAGDSFNGAYLATRLRGGPPVAAAEAGLALAAQVVGERGAVIPRK